MKKVMKPATAAIRMRFVFMEPPAGSGFKLSHLFAKEPSVLCAYTAGNMHRLKWIFLNERRLRAGWRVVIFIAAYLFGGKGLDALFTKLNLPVGFTWQGILGYEASDLVLVCAIAWILSRVEQERFSAYGLPLVPEAGKLLAKGLLWGFIPSALILIPIYLLGGCSFHGLALHGPEFVKYAL